MLAQLAEFHRSVAGANAAVSARVFLLAGGQAMCHRVSSLTFATACALVLGASPAPPRFVLGPGSPIAIGGAPGGIEAADLNRDGKLDLVVTNGRASAVELLFGDGRGGFAPAPWSPLAVGVPPHLSAVGDLNGDDRPDLAVTSHDSHGVFVWLGDGTGRFAPAPGSPFAALASGKPHNHGLALGDVDGDGDLDLLTTDDVAHAVAVLLNDGHAAFRAAPGSPFGVDREPYPLALGDVNGDGRLDVVTPNVGGASVSVLLGDGRGGFKPATGTQIAVTSRPYYVTLGDLDGDRKLDAVVSHDDVSLVTALLGDGHGGFRLAPGSPFDIGRRPWKAVLRDLDRDGKQDAVLAAGGAVVVMLGDGRGRLSPVPGSPFAVGRGAWSVAVGDFDGDGRSDIATADLEAGTLTILLQR
jgi:hypothetical protein